MENNSIHQYPLFRQNTLAELRWVAIAGQYISVLIAHFVFGLQFDLFAALFVITLWLAGNSVQKAVFFYQTSLDARSGFWSLIIDLAEISVLLYLTGGFNNPFIMFIIIPAIIAANTIKTRPLIVLNLLTIGAMLILFFNAQPMRFRGESWALTDLQRQGVFVSLSVLLAFLGFFVHRIAFENLNMTKALAASDLALQRERRLSSLGALVAAYAHELGTPLATIRLTASDLLDGELSDQARADVDVILQEAKRSAGILESMGKRGKEDEYVRVLPILTLVEEAAEPHLDRGKLVEFDFGAAGGLHVERSEGLIQGLRNLIQNAVDFGHEHVKLTLSKTDRHLKLRVSDDGDGFPPELLARLGEPFLHASNSRQRATGHGMGLGVFIAKTLLERSGAKLQFANLPRAEGGGATVLIEWPLERIMVDRKLAHQDMGENRLAEI